MMTPSGRSTGGTRSLFITLAGLAALVGGFPAGGTTPLSAQEGELQARVWLDRGPDVAYERGDRARVYYRVSESAYVAIFKIDTDGRIRLLYPRSPFEEYYTRGGRDYRLLFSQGRSPYWLVDDHPGMGYYFIVASPEPMDFSSFEYSARGGWDLTRVGQTAYRDPYVAVDEQVSLLLPDWEYVPYALDFAEYNVERVYEYPRFLCYNCHGYRPYSVWNPYRYDCSSFRVVIYNDPYYYPVYRYRGTRVVFVRPPRPRQPRFVFKERVRGEPAGPVVATRGSVGGVDVPRRVVPKEVGSGIAPEARGGASQNATPPRRSSPGGSLIPTRRSGAQGAPTRPSTGRAAPRAVRDPVVSPRLRPSDRLRSRSSGGTDTGRRSPASSRELPRAGGGAPQAREAPGATRSSPGGTRSTPEAVRPKPRVERRGGGSVAAGGASAIRSRPSSTGGRQRVTGSVGPTRRSGSLGTALRSLLSRGARAVGSSVTRGGRSQPSATGARRGTSASPVRGSGGSPVVQRRASPTVTRAAGSRASAKVRKTTKKRGGGGGL